jgi:hypothetical protein
MINYNRDYQCTNFPLWRGVGGGIYDKKIIIT